MKDTLDYRYFSDLPEPFSSDNWLVYDTIAFVLPKGYEIIETSQSYFIAPSIWAKGGDEVIQYFTFNDLGMHCTNSTSLKMDNNTLIKGFDINEKQMTELYFKNKKLIGKNEMLASLNKYYDATQLQIREMPIDESTTDSVKKKLLFENECEKKIYEGYLNSYTEWKKAPRDQTFMKDGSELPKEKFKLLDLATYLTLTIKKGDTKHKITIVYTPTHGN
jgi:hypothetical protein